ncbi:glycoside hydrolase family 19 protein [Acinetobacter schindleri]|uniref:glycoside hydrolase family 19 protein n=1 Tax=Acinetobacter schindleri TaxID=108981 RepID=UPI0034D5E5B5
MAQAGVIRDFMVALGFKTDNAGLNQMQGAMSGLEDKSKLLKGALLALATGAVVAVRQTASELDKLYFSSQRIGASVTNINAYGNAIAQLGGSAEGAIGSLESLAEKMRNSPGYEGQLNSLGVSTKDANGAMRDRVEVMKDLSGVLSKMPAYQANAYASSLGIDQNTLLAMRDGKFMSNMEKYQKIQKELGMNDDLAKSGNEFMSEYRDLTMMTKTGFQVIVMQAGKALIPILRLLNQMLQMGISAFSQLNPQIKEGLAVGLRFAMLAVVFGGFFKVFGMIFKFIPMLKSFIRLLKLFRLAFLASPIGIILALAAALALLYDDYKTWKEGGKSLFDWSKWTNGIDTIISKIKDFLEILDQVKDKVINFVQKVISDPAGAIKEVAEVAKEKLQETKEAVQETTKTVVENVKTTTKTAAVAAVGMAKATQQAVKDAILPNTREGKRQALIRAMVRGGITDKKEQAMFLAQMDHESGGFGRLTENLNYSKKGLRKTFGKYYKTDAQAARDARNPERIANRVYGGRMGNTAKGDGWKYRGRGFIQLTGKANYEAFYKDSGIDVVSNPDLAARPDVAAQIAVWYWNQRVKSKVPGGVKAVTKAINGGTNGLADRIEKTEKYSQLVNEAGFMAPATAITTTKPPSGNPHKSQVNSSNMTASNVTIHQSFKTDMTLNGVSSPIESANAVQRQQENSMAIAARGAKSLIG